MTSHSQTFQVTAVRSPASLTGEEKDQDRVRWSEPMATAAVCDGVSSSPFGAEAAELAAGFAPALFQKRGDPQAAIQTLADLLVVRRRERQRGPLPQPDHGSAAMQDLLREAAEAAMERSFQTTLVAAALAVSGVRLEVRVVSVGDSAFFAFSADGELLSTSLPDSGLTTPPAADGAICFGPGQIAVVKVLGPATENPALAEQAGIDVAKAGNWLICLPLDASRRNDAPTCGQQKGFLIKRGEPVLVPRYLAEPLDGREAAPYRCIPFSRTIRCPNCDQRTVSLHQKADVTAVLPDHIYTGRWCHFRESLPRNAHVVLATDGFYSAFGTPTELWQWLNHNTEALADDAGRQTPMSQLHQRLASQSGDDDASFVWVRATEPSASPEKEEPHAR